MKIIENEQSSSKGDSSVNGKLVNELKRLWLAKVSRKSLFSNFDNP